ncbi:1-deoxy-D-xylulose-5-phosphate synthase [Ruminococcaceae bacterium YRB3002]|nr:1-deoxy-D-xylulose-5-phosphate synthase [Ruminococcaceae bacterium YRB3002]
MNYRFLGSRLSQFDMKNMTAEDRKVLASELRDKILKTVSANGGHLASNLGVVELTIALLTVFDYEHDKIVFDVGHQSYSYKLMTGRFDNFDTLRQEGGISGFPRVSESQYDAFDTGHSSTSVSAALGMARARDLKGEKDYIISVIGDGALTGGLAFEGINDAGISKTPMIIILNDNEMSIDKNVGGLSLHLRKIRASSGYIAAKRSTESFLHKIPGLGNLIIKFILAIKDWFRFIVYRKTPSIFDDLGLVYYGPVDGHDTEALIETLNAVKDIEAPVLIHVATKKGKGYGFAEKNPSDYHGVGPFDLEKGVQKSDAPTFTSSFGNIMIDEAEENDKVVAVCAAMAAGTGLSGFAGRFPERFFDCGIAEGHCVTMASGLAISGFVPVVAIYSSFLQRAYDEMIHDCCFMNNHVVFAIDRAGFVGQDGHTHNGLRDISYLNSMPNMTVFAARDYEDLRHIMHYCINVHEGPCAVRYPRGSAEYTSALYSDPNECLLPHIVSDKGSDFAVISVGITCKDCDRAVFKLSKSGLFGKHINLSLIRPVPAEELIALLGNVDKVYICEEGIVSGGAYESIRTEIEKITGRYRFIPIAVEDDMIRAASPKRQREIAGIDAESIFNKIIGD